MGHSLDAGGEKLELHLGVNVNVLGHVEACPWNAWSVQTTPLLPG